MIASKITRDTLRNVKISVLTKKKGNAWNYLKFIWPKIQQGKYVISCLEYT